MATKLKVPTTNGEYPLPVPNTEEQWLYYFCGQALTGILASPQFSIKHDIVAKEAKMFAEEMLKELHAK